MNKKILLMMALIGLVVFSTACSGPGVEAPVESCCRCITTPESLLPTSTATVQAPEIQPTLTPRAFSPAQGGPLLIAKNEYFTASGLCAVCHNQNIDEAGVDVSLGEYWRSSLMANAALDPYYLAGVSMNVDRFPELGPEIESKCSTCHLPMAQTTDLFTGGESLIFGAGGYLDSQNPLHQLAVDGVSCTACHQIQDDSLGEFSSFSGGFSIDSETPMGARVLYGSYDLNQASQTMMAKSSGFISLKSDHLVQSELCATCHNLYTNYVTADGTLSAEWFPEQTPYTEWLHSDFADSSSCQDCHMPKAEGGVVLSNMGSGSPRSPFAKHSFVGGNAYMLGILNNFGGEMGVQAGAEHFEPTIDRTLTQLQNDTAQLEISPPELAGTSLSFDVTTRILTGHKFPTGYPSRRAWLQVTVKDSSGQIVFESGAVGQDGAIAGNANDQDSLAYEPHYTQITSPDQVQIYEAIMTDVGDQVTTVLLAASSYIKDNRLLPIGFDKNTAGADIKPAGTAFADENFTAGMDTVRYLIDVKEAAGPFSVEVELLYQSIAYRWAADLSKYDTEQSLLFTDYYNASPNLPIVIAEQTVQSD